MKQNHVYLYIAINISIIDKNTVYMRICPRDRTEVNLAAGARHSYLNFRINNIKKYFKFIHIIN